MHDFLCLSKGHLVHDTDVHKIYSTLNLTIICIKPFILKVLSLDAFKTWWNSDGLSYQAFINDIPSQMHPSPITLWWFILLFVLFVLPTGNKVLANSLYGIWVASQGYLIHIDLRCSSFWYLNPFEYLLVEFSSRLLTSSTCIHVSYCLLVPGS